MRSLASLISGIVVVVGTLFVSWLTVDERGGEGRFDRFFGRDVIGGDVDLVSASGPILTIIGGVLLIVIAIIAFIMIMANLRRRRTYLTLSLGARLAALLVIAGAAWYMADVNDVKDELQEEYFSPNEAKVMTEEGVLISLIGGVGGLVIGITTPFSVWNMMFRRREDEDNTGIGRKNAPVKRREEYYTAEDDVDGLALRKDYSDKLKAAADELPKGTPDEHFSRAVRYESEGKYDEAIREYDAAINGNANYSLAHSNRGSLHLVLGHSVKALYDFEKVVELSDDPNLVQMAQDRIDELNEQALDERDE